MGRSFSYAAYRALSRRRSAPDAPDHPPRPAGELVWMHACDATRFDALCDLASRLKALRPEVDVLMTLPAAVPLPEADRAGSGVDCMVRLGDDHPDAAERFLDHWKPDLCLWTGTDLAPNMIVSTSARTVPLLLLDVDGAALRTGGKGWKRGPQRRALSCFDTVLAPDAETRRYLRKLGVSASRLEVTGPLRAGATPPQCPEGAVDETTRQLAGRSTWLAAHLPAGEVRAVLRAHRYAVRLSHRLLLIIHPARDDEVDRIVAAAEDMGFRFVCGTSADPIDENTQVHVAADGEEPGLWYRVAPLSFMGGSFSDSAIVANPMDAAALGSAVLFGPSAGGTHADAFARLTDAGAARMVGGADALGQAVVNLIAPDRAAEMALAGWQVVTEGAELTDQVLERVQDMLDMARVAHART